MLHVISMADVNQVSDEATCRVVRKLEGKERDYENMQD
jgi:hypothetical protein